MAQGPLYSTCTWRFSMNKGCGLGHNLYPCVRDATDTGPACSHSGLRGDV